MSLKSLVNKSIIKSDLRRFWYMGIAFLCGMLLLVTIPAIDAAGRGDGYTALSNYVIETGLVAILPFGIVMPCVLFSYLHKKSAVCAVHSLPLSRECIFASHLISGVILTVVPLVANALIMLSVNQLYAPDIFKWVGLSLVYCVLLSGLSIFASAVSGNVFASMAIPVVIILLPIVTAALFEGYADAYLFGFSNAGEMSLTGIIGEWYLPYHALESPKMLAYIGLGIVCGVIGFVCYKKRALENNSSVTAFKSLNPVFMYGVAIYGGLIGAAYIYAISDVFSLWVAIPFGIIGIIVARMLIEKTFRPKKILKPSLILVAVIAVMYLFFGLDITGYEKRIPDMDEIASVDISGRYDNYERATYHEGERYLVVREAIEETKLTDKADIEKVLGLHKSIVDKPYCLDYEQSYLPVYYRLKNGKTLVRAYWYTPTDEQIAMRNTIDDIAIVKAYTLPLISDRECRYVSATVYRDNEGAVNITADMLQKLLEVLKEDVRKSTAAERKADTERRIEVLAELPVTDGTGKTTYIPSFTEYESYNVYPTYTNTIALLKEWEIY